MPKTRHEKFSQSFDKYMLQLKVNNMEYDLNYTLINTTDNQTKCIHSYTLEILGNREGTENTGENIITILPSTIDFINNMNNYFEPYILYGHFRIKMSYIKIITERSNDYVSTIDFEIHYFRDHLPFPLPLSVNEQLIQDIEILTTEIQEQGNELNRMRRKYKTEKEKLKRVQQNIQNRMQIMYNQQEILDDCPVCMEPIQKNNLYVPICFHNICNDCSKRCEKCPLCRERYVGLVH
tara:strand:- start:2402 stop:3112 length:711 start_codon:yes stop_codon:yes gene_type:complete